MADDAPVRERTFHFDRFTLHPPTRRLLCERREVHLSPKAFDLLTLLVEHRARAMSKDDLQAALWPSTYVLETNLASLVAEIRRALDDPADAPRFVRTVHRFGYWFVGDVQEGAARTETVRPVRAWLVWGGRQIALAPGENVLGRGVESTVWIDAPGVSRRHARIRVAADRATIEDLGSKNGTFLGGQLVADTMTLPDGGEIRLGSVTLTFRLPPPDGTETI